MNPNQINRGFSHRGTVFLIFGPHRKPIYFFSPAENFVHGPDGMSFNIGCM